MTYPTTHPVNCEVCGKFHDRIRALLERGFDMENATRWALHEGALGREICYHVYVGVPEWETSGMCATCWRPEWHEHGPARHPEPTKCRVPE